MNLSQTHEINIAKCSRCGECVRVCPDNAIRFEHGGPVFLGQSCLECGHCIAVCPADAINIKTLSNTMYFTTFSENKKWLPFGEFDTSALVQLMRSRRSCRNYTKQSVSRQILDDLVKIATTAPSGTNSQQWTFTVLENRQYIVNLGDRIGNFFKKLNTMASNPFLRMISRMFMKDKLGHYYRTYYATIAQGLYAWEKMAEDRLFHGATAVIIIGGKTSASCPAEDALLATQNILLASHAMGLGSCLIGFAVEAIKNDPNIKSFLEIPKNESVYSVIALGYPSEKYYSVTCRKPVHPRYISTK